MRCPFCMSERTEVKDTRMSDDGASVRRRRHCPDCMSRFTTVERVHLREMQVMKKDGLSETFDREKLAQSLRLALHKRPVSDDKIEKIATGIVRKLESNGESEVKSETIGELVMAALKEIDQVAYVRFASIYRNFHETKDFEKFIDDLRP